MINPEIISQSYKDILCNLLASRAKLLVVSKGQSIENIKHLVVIGQLDFGESYLQELKEKAIKMPFLKWHFIGNLQSKKIKHIVKYVNFIHSVEKFEQIEKINKYAKNLNKQISIFLQINIDNDINKSGFYTNEIQKVVTSIIKSDKLQNITIVGLMCLPEKNNDVKYSFDKMQKFYKKVNTMLVKSQKLNQLSMGMSRDYNEAINFGSTIVRIGSILFDKKTNTNKN